MELNRLTEELRRLCSGRPLEEKWLLAPSHRAGRQWLDAVTRSGTAVLNVRVMTVVGMALELAAPELERRGLTYAAGMRLELVLEDLISRRGVEGGYLAGLAASPGLSGVMAASFRDLRMAGVKAGDLTPSCFEVTAKGEELASLLAAYEQRLASLALADLPDALRFAATRLREDPHALPPGCLVALPAYMREGMPALERALWEAVPEDRKVLLDYDRPCVARDGDLTDAALLAWVDRPAEAPAPAGDGSVEFFRATGEANEVREVLRRCAASGIPFDEVEILHTDYQTYVPLIYEICHALWEDGEDMPVTFAEGIPVRYSRPGRALAGWLSWVLEGFPQEALARMLEDGLLETEDGDGVRNFSVLAAVLRSLPIGLGRERYGEVIRGELDRDPSPRERNGRFEDGGDEEAGEREGSIPGRSSALRSLSSLLDALLSPVPRDPGAASELLAAAEDFLSRRVRCTGELDEYARRKLLKGVRELSAGLRDCGTGAPDIVGRLRELADSSRVEGKSPRPGCLHVASLRGGGHSGRSHVFILGLDDGRFPGAGLQDPLLLDSEREAISDELPTAAGRMAAAMEDLARVMAGLRARVTMGYCCRDLEEDREMFPSQAVLSAYRIVSGNREAVQDDLLGALREPASFAPLRPGMCITETEWWIGRLCGDAPPPNAEEAVFAAYPHLGRGRTARLAREGEEFTDYDGFVPEAGAELDPARPDSPVFSASQLETLGRCPLEYFFAYVLGIRPPEEFVLDPSRWLEANEKGAVLHEVFGDFHRHLREEGRSPSLERDWDFLSGMLLDRLSLWERRKPPPNQEVARVEREEMLRTARIFLMEDEIYCRENRPLYFEAAAGMESSGAGNPIDRPEAVRVDLPGGECIRVSGRMDRVDELGEPGSALFSVLDYKTGSAWGFDIAKPFMGGRRLQHYLYLAMAKELLGRVHPRAKVASFQYFFPSSREHGERVVWDAESLHDGPLVLACLREMLAGGCFPFTDDKNDVRFSDYLPAFGDVEALEKRCRERLAGTGNPALDPFRRLRGHA
ncbi:MAG: PD-(D/E)XK nuclease family protein [Actinomycetota bacterium]|nr:PD-(D/E)XK nuclease family protein [Actinomycetota bacterium]